MNKGILILNEIPENCYNCKITGSCRNLTKKNPDFNIFDRPYWCPLREVPKEKKGDVSFMYDAGFQDGYNACLKDILEE